MLKGMKPLPKALILAVVIAAPIWAYTQFMPKSAPKVEAPVVVEAPTPVPAESEAVKRAAQLVDTPPPNAATPSLQAPVSPTPSNDAGLANVLGSTKK